MRSTTAWEFASWAPHFRSTAQREASRISHHEFRRAYLISRAMHPNNASLPICGAKLWSAAACCCFFASQLAGCNSILSRHAGQDWCARSKSREQARGKESACEVPTIISQHAGRDWCGRLKSREQAHGKESGSKLPHSKASHASTRYLLAVRHCRALSASCWLA